MKVVSFNMLAQSKIKREMFPKASHDTLKWHHRRGRLEELLKGFQADLLALQEVDSFSQYWDPFLKEQCQLQGRFASKSDRVGRGDGLYTGWNPLVLTLIEYDIISMSSLMSELMQSGAHPNTAQLFVFECINTTMRFCFINTHLYWAPGFDALRRNQMALIVQVCKERFGNELPIIICGDLNSDPESECCRYLKSVGFESVCGRLPFTVCSVGVFTDTLDHIWVKHDGKLYYSERVLVDLDHVVSQEEGGIPNISHPSDHLPIGAEIGFIGVE